MSYVTKCGFCQGTSFEVKTIEPQGAAYKQSILQCFNCGAPVGVMDFFNLGALLKGQEKEIADLKKQVGTLRSGLQTINSNLEVIARKIR